MGIFKGGALRLLQTALYFINFCCAAVILGMSTSGSESHQAGAIH